jgi:hypothetical protein
MLDAAVMPHAGHVDLRIGRHGSLAAHDHLARPASVCDPKHSANVIRIVEILQEKRKLNGPSPVVLKRLMQLPHPGLGSDRFLVQGFGHRPVILTENGPITRLNLSNLTKHKIPDSIFNDEYFNCICFVADERELLFCVKLR